MKFYKKCNIFHAKRQTKGTMDLTRLVTATRFVNSPGHGC